MSSSTSSSDPPGVWRRFVLALLAMFAGGSAALFLLLAALDPWGALPLHLSAGRVPADHSQRWAYPELARDAGFDAAIIGDSTARLINPAALDPATGARFVNLAMVQAQAFEQLRLLDVFLAAHPHPRAVLVGLDQRYCDRGDDLPHFGYDPIPDWLYRNDLLAALGNLLNLRAIDTAWRSLGAVLGRAPRPYGANGYALIGVDHHPYDPALAKSLMQRDESGVWPDPTSPDPATWHYVALDWLRARLATLPADTRKLLVFVPRHHHYPPPGPGVAMFEECKRQTVAMARELSRAQVIDFSIPSPTTTENDRWWDAVHLRPEAMERMSADLARALAGEEGEDYRILSAGPGLAERM